MTFDKGTKKSFFNKWYWNNQIFTCKRNWTPVLYHIKINSKCVDLTVRARSIKLLGKKSINVYLYDSVLGNDFLDMTSKAQGTKQIN